MMMVSAGRDAGSAAGLDAGVSASPDTDGRLFVSADVRPAPACVAALWRATELPGHGIQLGESFFRCSVETDHAPRAGGAGLVVCQSSRAEAAHIGRDVHEGSALHNGVTRSRVVPCRRRHLLVPSIAFWGATLLNEVLPSGSAVQRSAVRELVCGSSTLLRA